MARQKKPFDAVQFTRESAERVARVVRQAELTPAAASPLTFRKWFADNAGRSRAIRICTFTGDWSIGSAKTVAYKYQTTTPNTASATNLFFPVTSTATLDCAIGKDGTAWFLIDVPFYTVSSVIVSSVSVSATLNTNNCQITVSTMAGTSTATLLQIGKP
jgi:hypothetical protein